MTWESLFQDRYIYNHGDVAQFGQSTGLSRRRLRVRVSSSPLNQIEGVLTWKSLKALVEVCVQNVEFEKLHVRLVEDVPIVVLGTLVKSIKNNQIFLNISK